jgi:hypothetical protein
MATPASLTQSSLFAEDIALLKALPSTQQVLVVSIAAALSSVAVTCLVVCLSIILFTVSTPLHSNVIYFFFEMENRSIPSQP